jgi:asparagine synthase (glutamine-hydrolysing)
MLNELTAESVPIILHEDDLNAMYHSVENRSPYLDRSLAEFCFTIPTAHLIRDGFGKAVLREAVRGIVPSAVVDNPRKIGFNLTVTELLDGRDPRVRSEVLADSPIWDIVRREAVAPLLDRDCLTNSDSKFLFSLVSSKAFLEEFSA